MLNGSLRDEFGSFHLLLSPSIAPTPTPIPNQSQTISVVIHHTTNTTEELPQALMEVALLDVDKTTEVHELRLVVHY